MFNFYSLNGSIVNVVLVSCSISNRVGKIPGYDVQTLILPYPYYIQLILVSTIQRYEILCNAIRSTIENK